MNEALHETHRAVALVTITREPFEHRDQTFTKTEEPWSERVLQF
jgi:hypothetical protein